MVLSIQRKRGNKRMKVICVERKSGEYQGRSYDNFIVHCVHNAVSNEKIKGSKTEVIKLKAVEFEKLNPFTWLDKSIELTYDKYGRVVNCSIK